MENLNERPQLTFIEALKAATGKLFVFKGRSRRSEYWWVMLAVLIAYLVFEFTPFVGDILRFITSILILGLTTRRLHDTGHSGWWIVANFIASCAFMFIIASVGLYSMTKLANPNPEEVLELFTNPLVIISGIVSFIIGLTVFVFTLLDSKPEPNKYGESPKYYIEGE